MDEIIFRTSQKLENLQIQAALTAQQAQILYQRISERGLVKFRELWNSQNVEQIQQIIRELIAQFIELTEKGADFIATNLRVNNFVDSFIRLLKFEINRTQLICGFTGFFLGAIFGYSYASFTRRPSLVVSHMKSAVCTTYGGIEAVNMIEDMPQPKITEPDDVLIQVRASSVCNVDVEICNGYGKRLRKLLCRYNNPFTRGVFPIILGRSCSGIVLEIGSNVKRLEISDEVYLTSPFWAQGTTSEYIVTKEYLVSQKPSRIGFEYAAGLPYAGGHALTLLKTAGITQSNAQDKRVLICGATTPIGCVLIQYCHLLQADVTTITNSKSAPVATALGADDIIVYQSSKSDLETDNVDKSKAILKELDLRETFNVIFITNETGLNKNHFKKFLKTDGSIHFTLPIHLFSDNYNIFSGTFYWSYIRLRCALQNIFGWRRSNFGEVEIDYHQLDMLSELVDKNQLHSVVDKVFHPQDIETALEHVQSSESIGSTIITFK